MNKIILTFGIIVVIFCLFTGAIASVSGAEKTGVLVLAHGGNEAWDKAVNEAADPLRKRYPVEVAFGMANPTSMQKGIDKLESKGVTRIVVVQLFVSSFSPIIRQNEYLLGLRKELADPPMLMDPSMMMRAKRNAPPISTDSDNTGKSGSKSKQDKNISHEMGSSGSMERQKKVSLNPLKINARIVLTKPLDDNEMVIEILLDHIRELVRQPENETIVLVAHGPNTEKDNRNWINTMDSIIDQMRVKQSATGKRFKQIFGLTVRDDAPKAIYEQAKEHLRMIVYQAGKEGDVIVIPLLLARGGVEAGVAKRLSGLRYKWNGKTLLPHVNISRFIQASVNDALE